MTISTAVETGMGPKGPNPEITQNSIFEFQIIVFLLTCGAKIRKDPTSQSTDNEVLNHVVKDGFHSRCFPVQVLEDDHKQNQTYDSREHQEENHEGFEDVHFLAKTQKD